MTFITGFLIYVILGISIVYYIYMNNPEARAKWNSKVYIEHPKRLVVDIILTTLTWLPALLIGFTIGVIGRFRHK